MDTDPDSDIDPEERKSQPNGYTGRLFFVPVFFPARALPADLRTRTKIGMTGRTENSSDA
jgi:hypothetical protein